jgi:hypothetical protein
MPSIFQVVIQCVRCSGPEGIWFVEEPESLPFQDMFMKVRSPRGRVVATPGGCRKCGGNVGIMVQKGMVSASHDTEPVPEMVDIDGVAIEVLVLPGVTVQLSELVSPAG